MAVATLAAVGAIAQGIGGAVSAPPSTAVSGGNPHDAKQFQINVTPTGVNLGELIQQLTGGTPQNGGFGLSPNTLTPISTSNINAGSGIGSVLTNPIFLIVTGAVGIIAVIRLVKK